MVRSPHLLGLLIATMIFSHPAVLASTVQAHSVPDASTYTLAPLGIAAIFMAERRRRRLAQIQQGVGLVYHFIKRMFDIALALALVVVFSPVFALLAGLVRLDSPGPIIFRRRVIGKNGISFDMFKFRSMVDQAEEILEQDKELWTQYSQNFKLEEDPRVTRLGRFLRKSSLDELPQLFNILLGNMTFVGPRPIHKDEIDLYGPSVQRFTLVKPGITGLWQTTGRSDTSYEQRVRLDMLYIEQRSILMDLSIVLRTVPAVLMRRGAC